VLAALALAVGAGVTPSDARAEDIDAATPPLADVVRELRPLTGTLARVKRAGAIRLGHRSDAVPFAFVARGRPVGYSLDLCRTIASEAAAELGVATLRVELVPVTAEDRLRRVASGEVDIECGATTSTSERRNLVSFSPTIFVSATRLMVRSAATVRELRDLRAATVAVVRGTSSVSVVEELSARAGLGLRRIEASDYGEAFALLDAGRAGALAGDEVLLAGYLAERGARAGYRTVGPALSHEPYALAFQRGDAAFTQLVARVFRRLAERREIVAVYRRWFLQPLPSGERLGLPMSAELRELWRIQGLPGDGS
jgi:glutamate/aspartate transport system substrate-binding protein